MDVIEIMREHGFSLMLSCLIVVTTNIHVYRKKILKKWYLFVPTLLFAVVGLASLAFWIYFKFIQN